MIDRAIGGQGPQSADPTDDAAHVLRELVEALTALGNYLAAADRIADGADPIGADIRNVLARAIGEHERAATALRQLQRLLLTH